MQERFDMDRASEAAGFILRAAATTPQRNRTYGELLKLLYLADRRALQETGSSITGDAPCSMEQGPVLSKLYDVVMGRAAQQELEIWGRFTKRVGAYLIVPGVEVSTRNLSRYHLRILEETVREFGQLEFKALSVLTHEFPEYTEIKADDPVKSIPIDPAEILRDAGYSDDDIEDFAAMAAERRYDAPLRAAQL